MNKLKELYPYIGIVIVVVLIRSFLFTPAIVNGSLVISPVGEFYKKIGKYDVFKNYDFNSLSDKDKVLFGLCENKSTLTEVVNTNILKRKI